MPNPFLGAKLVQALRAKDGWNDQQLPSVTFTGEKLEKLGFNVSELHRAGVIRPGETGGYQINPQIISKTPPPFPGRVPVSPPPLPTTPGYERQGKLFNKPVTNPPPRMANFEEWLNSLES